MVTLLTCACALPFHVEENDLVNANFLIVDNQEQNLKNQDTLEDVEGADAMETAQSIFRPLFVYRKLSEQRFPTVRRSGNIVRRRQVPRYAYYY